MGYARTLAPEQREKCQGLALSACSLALTQFGHRLWQCHFFPAVWTVPVRSSVLLPAGYSICLSAVPAKKRPEPKLRKSAGRLTSRAATTKLPKPSASVKWEWQLSLLVVCWKSQCLLYAQQCARLASTAGAQMTRWLLVRLSALAIIMVNNDKLVIIQWFPFHYRKSQVKPLAVCCTFGFCLSDALMFSGPWP